MLHIFTTIAIPNGTTFEMTGKSAAMSFAFTPSTLEISLSTPKNALATEAIRANISPIPILSIYTDEEVNLFASLYASAVSTELFFN